MQLSLIDLFVIGFFKPLFSILFRILINFINIGLHFESKLKSIIDCVLMTLLVDSPNLSVFLAFPSISSRSVLSRSRKKQCLLLFHPFVCLDTMGTIYFPLPTLLASVRDFSLHGEKLT